MRWIAWRSAGDLNNNLSKRKRPANIRRRVNSAVTRKSAISNNKVGLTLVTQGILPFFFIDRIGEGTGLEYYLPLIGLVATVFYFFSDRGPLFFNRLPEYVLMGTFALLIILLSSKFIQVTIFHEYMRPASIPFLLCKC